MGPAVGAIPLNSVLWVWWSALPILGLTLHLATAQQLLKQSPPPEQLPTWNWHRWWWLAGLGWVGTTVAALNAEDPAVAWGIWWQWTVVGVGCWWLYQLRQQLATTLLFVIVVAALFQSGLGILQKHIVFPRLIAEITAAAEQNADHALVNRFGSAQVLERLRNGGVYGSLLLANIYALVCGIGAILAGQHLRRQPAVIIPVLICLFGVYLSGAKGAVIAIAAGVSLSWMLNNFKSRWWAAIVLISGVITAWWMSSGAQLSLAVRADYWRGTGYHR